MKYLVYQHIGWLVLLCLLSSCGAYFNQPMDFQAARTGESTEVTDRLRTLPEPEIPVYVGVYKFEDQTGQYKAIENGSSFSTAVTQGGTAILLKALEDSKWFKVLERENRNNLYQERALIQETREDFARRQNQKPVPLEPLLYAGVLIEGAVVSYDTNVLTGGIGARYFGAGGSSKYRQDRVTIYLRVISVKTGEVMKTVYISKSIYSQAVDASLFRYVSFKRLLEAETGFTRNEPGQLALKEAIEKGVESLIVEGIESQLWYPKNGLETATKMIANYYDEKQVAERTDVYQRDMLDRRSKWRIDAAAGGTYIRGDLPNATYEYNLSTGIKYAITPHFGLTASVQKFRLKNTDLLNREFASSEINMEVNILPFEKLSPYIYAGAGLHHQDFFKVNYLKAQAGTGVEFLVSPSVGIKAFADYSVPFTDDIDRLVTGVRDDHYIRYGAGINIYLGKNDAKLLDKNKQRRLELKKIDKQQRSLKKTLRDKQKQEKKLLNKATKSN